MTEIREIADNADLIVNGYSFKRENDRVRVFNLNHPGKASVFSLEGDALETNMDEIEVIIVQDYYSRNRRFLEELNA